MHIKVDQSGRIEQPVDTVLAFSNAIDYAILVPRGVKRVAARHLREEVGKDKERAALINVRSQSRAARASQIELCWKMNCLP